MRRKLTEPSQTSDDLPDLTVQQAKFVEGLLEGNTASDAYRAAYDCSSMQPNSVWRDASLLTRHPKVSQWLLAAREAGLGRAVVTLEGHLAELQRLREIALKTGNVGAAVQAEQLRGKASGHYKESIDVSVHDPIDTLREIAKLSPELAVKLAKEYGLEYEAIH